MASGARQSRRRALPPGLQARRASALRRCGRAIGWRGRGRRCKKSPIRGAKAANGRPGRLSGGWGEWQAGRCRDRGGWADRAPSMGRPRPSLHSQGSTSSRHCDGRFSTAPSHSSRAPLAAPFRTTRGDHRVRRSSTLHRGSELSPLSVRMPWSRAVQTLLRCVAPGVRTSGPLAPN